MKSKSLIFAVILGAVLPWVLFMVTEKVVGSEELPEATEALQPEIKISINVLRADGNVDQMELEEYVVGVVMGEMPSGFEMEALKAQAIAARTFAVKSMYMNYKHDNCDVCTDSSCCQSYYDPKEFLSNGGDPQVLSKYQNAILDTAGQVLVYNGELIEATYFSCSGGKTEDAVSVWGTDIPYLKSLVSPGEEHAAHFTYTVVMSASEFIRKLGEEPAGLPGTWIKGITYTRGGGVATICIGNKTYKGTELRQKLGLRSTAFVMSVVGDSVTITTKGFGHRVGMSQYGADAMAVQGNTYIQILAYYYPGTSLSALDQI